MLKKDELTNIICEQVFKLGARGMNGDPDCLLASLLDVLQKLPIFRVQRKGFIRLYNPRHRLVTVAQHGFHPVWTEPSLETLLEEISQKISFSVTVIPGASSSSVIIIPVIDDNQLLGQIIVFMEGTSQPSDSEIKVLACLIPVFSGMVMRCMMNERLQARQIELEDARAQTIRSLGTAAEYRDHEIGLHVMRMTNFAMVIAKALDLSHDERELLYITAPMHDVGKIGIEDGILLKPGKLSDDEFEKMKAHTDIGERLLHGSDALLVAAREIAASHHENWDGSGYPRGRKGEEIPILARICAVADVFDALTSKRPYKDAWPIEEAIREIRGESGKKFDPAVVAAFETALPEIMRICELYREDIIDPRQILNLIEPTYNGTRWVTWDETLSVGVAVIDEHHRYLFDLTNDLINVVVSKQGAREIARVLKVLSQYAQVHFRAEERMMEHYGFPGLSRQKQQHQHMQDKLVEFYEEFRENPYIAQHEIMNYLQEWLVGHILHEDIQLRDLVD